MIKDNRYALSHCARLVEKVARLVEKVARLVEKVARLVEKETRPAAQSEIHKP